MYSDGATLVINHYCYYYGVVVDDAAGDVGIASSPESGPRRLGGSPPGPRRQWRRADRSHGPCGINPLVNVYITMERSTIFNGKIHYKYLYMVIFNSYVKLPEGTVDDLPNSRMVIFHSYGDMTRD